MGIVSRSAVTISALFGALWITARMLAWEPTNVKRGSIGYELKVSSRAKEWPLWGATGGALYSFRHADGAASGYTEIKYTSAESIEALSAIARNHGYTCVSYSTGSLLCDLKRGEVSLVQLVAKRINSHEALVAVSVFEE